MDRDTQLAEAVAAAERLFDAPGESDEIFEPFDAPTAVAALCRFAKLFDELRGIARTVMESARNSGDLVSSDPLQGLAEMVQNADDLEATEVRLLLEPTELLVSHNGNPVRLRHVLALATPWLTTKGGEAALMGRFGIGLTTLRSLSETLEVHCNPYHVRFGDPFITPIHPRRMPAGFDLEGWTTFRVPLAEGKVSPAEVSTWLGRWDDSAMLFLRTVSKIALRTPNGATLRELAISRHRRARVSPGFPSAADSVWCEKVTAHDGRSWMVYRAESPTPEGVARAHKATEPTTPLGIALPLQEVESGKVHAGLPVAPAKIAVFANAQFDPTTSRQEFPDNEWNRALVPLVAELWAVGVLDAFDHDPRSAWRAIPVAEAAAENSEMPVIRRLEAEVIVNARQQVAPRLVLPVPGKGKLPLLELAVEDRPLERVLTLAETAQLAGLDATVPVEVRDAAGKWREVLDDWRTSGVDLPTPVTVDQALTLLQNEARPPRDVIALCSVGLKEGLSRRLLELPCVVARDDRRLVPPLEDAPEAVALDVSPLAQQLGVVTPLHPAHLEDVPSARRVLHWLQECGAVVDGTDDRQVVHRLAVAGRSGRHSPRPLQVEQLQALRAVFEQFEQQDRERLGPDIGRALELESYVYVLKGKKRHRTPITAQAVDAYLPREIEREERGFAVAANTAPGVVWISGRYARQLRSPLGRRGIGPQRFLRLLGAETAPRLRLHPQLKQRFAIDPRQALEADIDGGLSTRANELSRRGATHTLEDRDSPALAVVIEDIARMRRSRQRRRRAAAMLSTLARAWDRLGDYAEVPSASAYRGWNERGPVPAYWLCRASDVGWLDDERGKPRRPSELRVRTAGTEALFGADSPDYLHPDLSDQNWQPVLRAMGVSGDPSRGQLVTRLSELRAAMEAGTLPLHEAVRETHIVYKALARSLESPSPADLSPAQLRQEFSRGNGLILTDSGWHTPERVFAGEAVLGRYAQFAPAVTDTSKLWEALRLRHPSVMDCVKVIRKIARRFPVDSEDTATLLDALRRIADAHSGNAKAHERRALRELPLLTHRGWARNRPVYATDDPLLADGLGDRVPVWNPGGQLEQFRAILEPLRVRPVDTANAEVVNPELAEEDEESTGLLRVAIQQLREDLVRNEAELARSLTVPWEHLESLTVHIHPSLALRVPLDGAGIQYECRVAAKVDLHRCAVFVRRREDLASVDRGGRALSLLFKGDGRRLAHAWRGACDRAEEGRPATLLQLAHERAAREERENEARLEERMKAFQEGTHQDRAGGRAGGRQEGDSRMQSGSGRSAGEGGATATTPVPVRRALVDPSTLRLRDSRGRITEETESRKRATRPPIAAPVEPEGPTPPRSRTPPPDYTAEERERVGLELLQKVLGSEVVDVRAKRRVGADALDQHKRPFELKVSTGSEPDVVTLTASEVMRAATDPNFVLVVVSGIEGPDAKPTVRLFLDPLKQLQPGTDESQISLSGVRSSRSLLYEFEPGDLAVGPESNDNQPPTPHE